LFVLFGESSHQDIVQVQINVSVICQKISSYLSIIGDIKI